MPTWFPSWLREYHCNSIEDTKIKIITNRLMIILPSITIKKRTTNILSKQSQDQFCKYKHLFPLGSFHWKYIMLIYWTKMYTLATKKQLFQLLYLSCLHHFIYCFILCAYLTFLCIFIFNFFTFCCWCSFISIPDLNTFLLLYLNLPVFP